MQLIHLSLMNLKNSNREFRAFPYSPEFVSNCHLFVRLFNPLRIIQGTIGIIGILPAIPVDLDKGASRSDLNNFALTVLLCVIGIGVLIVHYILRRHLFRILLRLFHWFNLLNLTDDFQFLAIGLGP